MVQGKDPELNLDGLRICLSQWIRERYFQEESRPSTPDTVIMEDNDLENSRDENALHNGYHIPGTAPENGYHIPDYNGVHTSPPEENGYHSPPELNEFHIPENGLRSPGLGGDFHVPVNGFHIPEGGIHSPTDNAFDRPDDVQAPLEIFHSSPSELYANLEPEPENRPVIFPFPDENWENPEASPVYRPVSPVFFPQRASSPNLEVSVADLNLESENSTEISIQPQISPEELERSPSPVFPTCPRELPQTPPRIDQPVIDLDDSLSPVYPSPVPSSSRPRTSSPINLSSASSTYSDYEPAEVQIVNQSGNPRRRIPQVPVLIELTNSSTETENSFEEDYYPAPNDEEPEDKNAPFLPQDLTEDQLGKKRKI